MIYMINSNPNILLDSISDGDWHQIDELAAETHLGKDPIRELVKLFSDYGFIELNPDDKSIRLDKMYQQIKA